MLADTPASPAAPQPGRTNVQQPKVEHVDHALEFQHRATVMVHVLERGRVGGRSAPQFDALHEVGPRWVTVYQCRRCGMFSVEWREYFVDDEGRERAQWARAVGIELEALAVVTSMQSCAPLHTREELAAADASEGRAA